MPLLSLVRYSDVFKHEKKGLLFEGKIAVEDVENKHV
jgi:hypothetical protein